MYFLLRQITFVRLLMPFAIGIIAGIYFDDTISDVGILLPVTLLMASVFITHKFITDYAARWIHGLLIILTFFVLGFLFSNVNKLKHQPNYFENFANNDALLIVKINEKPKEKERSYKAEAEVRGVFADGVSKSSVGKLQLYFSKDDSLKIQYGDWLIIKRKNIQELEPPKNPHEFDYRQFLAFKQVHHQAFLRKDNYRYLKHDAENLVLENIIALNDYFETVLHKYVSNPQSLAIASSLLLGNREYLDMDLIKAYSSSGAMHVLAVSGLHVGILFLMLDKLLFFIDKKKFNGRLIKSLLTVIIIWIYAMLTGFSPSVQRAAIMFSLISIGQNIGRSYNIYNILAGSAVFQLLLNPFTIMEVGFQLSYAAVLGIVMFQKFFYDLWYIKNKMGDYFWQITCVSLAAQLITFPIGLLYFHQFPLYFFISNLVVIPAAFCIMLMGVTMLILSSVPYVAYWMGKLLNMGIFLMNKGVFLVEQLPYALIQGLSISITEVWFIYILIFLFFLFIHYRNPKIVFASLICVLFLTAINTTESYRQLNQKQFVIYNTPKQTYAYDFISGKENLLLASKSLTENYSQMQFHIMHNWWEQDVRRHNTQQFENSFDFKKGDILFQRGNYIQFYNKRMVLINDKLPKNTVPEKLKVDYVILQNNPKIKLEEIHRLYEYELIIADGSNVAKNIRKWKKIAAEEKINFRSVNDNGAFVLNL